MKTFHRGILFQVTIATEQFLKQVGHPNGREFCQGSTGTGRATEELGVLSTPCALLFLLSQRGRWSSTFQKPTLALCGSLSEQERSCILYGHSLNHPTPPPLSPTSKACFVVLPVASRSALFFCLITSNLCNTAYKSI